MQIWDTAGQDRFKSIAHAYYRGANGALIVFDLTLRSSFDNITRWMKELQNNTGDEIITVLIGM